MLHRISLHVHWEGPHYTQILLPMGQVAPLRRAAANEAGVPGSHPACAALAGLQVAVEGIYESSILQATLATRGQLAATSSANVSPVLVFSLLRYGSKTLPKGLHWAPHEGDRNNEMTGGMFAANPAEIRPKMSRPQNPRSEGSSHAPTASFIHIKSQCISLLLRGVLILPAVRA